jgi:hypothetical protein
VSTFQPWDYKHALPRPALYVVLMRW